MEAVAGTVGDMASNERSPSSALAAVGLDHVRLAYDYLDRGDTDGFVSLLDARAVLRRPCQPPLRGRAEVERHAGRQPAGRHTLGRVFGADRNVTAVGRFAGVDAAGRVVDVEFADVFTLAENGLLLSQQTFYFADPCGSSPAVL